MSSEPVDLWKEPDTIDIGKGMTMTFLRNSEYLTRIVFTADHEGLSVPMHYHELHDEGFRVVKGRVQYTLGEAGAKFKAFSLLRATTRWYGPEDGEINIPKGTAHALFIPPGEEVIIEEKTDPMDEEKEVFFRNVFGIGGLNANPFAVMQIFYFGDGYPVLPGGPRFLEKGLVTLLGRYIAPLLGHKPLFDINNLKKHQ
ncbi:hypothetical protein ONZ45_g7405 [Pleurotus djamor]|nr:hypothetical protein ONZ45_g9226 [Pleurotus djamor]KAJ8515137.1 hypothetical protein ONZ45_g7405 [Pleurotus djamor]